MYMYMNIYVNISCIYIYVYLELSCIYSVASINCVRHCAWYCKGSYLFDKCEDPLSSVLTILFADTPNPWLI